jgi:hypothetical protein
VRWTGFETLGVELLKDQLEPLEHGGFATTRFAQRMHLGRDVDEVGEVVRQIGSEQIQIVSPPGIVNVRSKATALKTS